MKATWIVSLLAAAFFVVLSPVAASAYTPAGSGLSNSGAQASGGGCFSTTFTATGAPGDEIAFELANSSDDVVYDDTKTADADGVATFAVEQCEPGRYRGTAFASDGSVLGTSIFVVPSSIGSGNGAGGSDSSGGSVLPSTGSTPRDVLALSGGLALLVVGGVAFVAARRRSA